MRANKQNSSLRIVKTLMMEPARANKNTHFVNNTRVEGHSSTCEYICEDTSALLLVTSNETTVVSSRRF